MFMKASAYLSSIILIFIAICGGIYAFFGVDALLFLCFYSLTVKRIVLAAGFVCALFLLYAILFFKPFKSLR